MKKFGEDGLKFDGQLNAAPYYDILNLLDEKFASASVRDELISFLVRAHDQNRSETSDPLPHPWIVVRDITHPNKLVDIGAQRFYRGYVIMAGCGKQLHEMTREEEDDFLAREGFACFLPLINEKIYALVEGVPLISSIPKPDLLRAPVPDGAVRITIEQAALDHHWSDCSMASTLVFQAFVQAGYRNVTHRSGAFPSRNYHEMLAKPVESIRSLENSDRQARETGTPQHALRHRAIIIDQLPNLDEDGIPKTTLTYRNGRPVGPAGGPYWNRQPKEG